MEGPATKVRQGRGGGGGDMERLPEECISRVLSFTSPRDVCRSSAVSKELLSAAKSDLVWDRFLPPDHEEILHRSSPPVAFSSKRDLYFRLCDSIHIDGGNKILWLEKATGKKCFMVSARAISISGGEDHRYWRWISLPDARFPEVAELLKICWLEIRASVSSRELSPATRYGAHLVMRYSDRTYGLVYPLQDTVISVGGVPAAGRRVLLEERGVPGDGDEVQAPDQGEGICVPRGRGDNWMELEMGDFFIEAGGEQPVDVWLQGWQRLDTMSGLILDWKSGLIVHGVEMRPMT